MTSLFLQGPTTFHLAAGQKETALAHLQAYYDAHIREQAHHDEAPHPFTTLEEGLLTLRWEASADANGDITFVSFTGQYFVDEHGALEAIACCVTAGSSLIVSIEHEGQHGFDVEQWLFDGFRMHRLEATFSFSSLPTANPDQMSTPQLLVGVQKGLSLGMQCFLFLQLRHPELASAVEQTFLQEREWAELIHQNRDQEGQMRYLLSLLVATLATTMEQADAND